MIGAAIWEYERIRSQTYRIISRFKQFQINVRIEEIPERFFRTLMYTIMHRLANRMEGRDGSMVEKLDGRTEDVCAYMLHKRGRVLGLASAGTTENDGALFLRQSCFQ